MIKRELVQFLIVALVSGLMGGCSKNIKDFETSTSYPIVKIEENNTQNAEESATEEMSSEEDTYLITSEAESEETESEVEMSEEEITEEETVEETFVEETTTVEFTEVHTTKLETEDETTRENITTEANVEQTIVHQIESETQKYVESSTEQHTETTTEVQTEAQVETQAETSTEQQTETQTDEVVDDHSDVDSYIDYSHGEPCLVYTERGVRKQADWIVEKFRSDVGYNPAWSKEYKAIKTFNWISNFMTYDIEVLRNPSKAFRNDYEWTGLGICDTYARAVLTILNSCNVEAHYMVSWQRNHAYVKVVIDGKEYICNSLGTEFKSLKNPHLAIGWYDEGYYKKYFEELYGPFSDRQPMAFTDEEIEQIMKNHNQMLFRALAADTDVPADIYMDDHCGNAGSWFDLGYGVSERQLSFPGLYR